MSIPEIASIGVTAMFDATLSDESKEQAVRKAGLKLIALSWQIAWRITAALLAAFFPIVFTNTLGIADWTESVSILLRIDFLVLVSVGAIVVGWIISKKKQLGIIHTEKISNTSNYGPGDRMLHAMAFSDSPVNTVLARIENRFYKKKINSLPDASPIFITSLARGGTTALLNAMHDLPRISTHKYCDMPFLHSPIIWSKLSGRRMNINSRERSHGDGIKIGLQSPEAFDEVFWMKHWPNKYNEATISLWSKEDYEKDAVNLFQEHFRKITLLRHPNIVGSNNIGPIRYLSKNNANIARIQLLPAMFTNCHILVPIREPSAHAASLYRQHQNFSKLHLEDNFSMRYMRDLGHFEFGSLHKPIAFPNSLPVNFLPNDPNYWLSYWINCFEYILSQAANVTIIPQQILRENPEQTMSTVLEILKVSNVKEGEWRNHFIKTPDNEMDHLFDILLLKRARDVYNELLSYSSVCH